MNTICGSTIIQEYMDTIARRESFAHALRELAHFKGEPVLSDLAKDNRPSVKLLLEGYKSANTMLQEMMNREYQAVVPCMQG